jgi:ferredoxin
VITGSAMIKDETRCIRCGLCAARCPVEVITMEAYHVETVGLPQLVRIESAKT